MAEGDSSQPVRQSPEAGRYANLFRIGFNAFEMVIEFGEQFSEGDAARMHTRVVTNPVFARGLVDALNEALSNYASAYSSELRN